LEEAARHLAEIVPLVVIKRGAAGAMARSGGNRFEAAAVRVTPVDAVGAGDSFNAGFISQYIQGAKVETCLAYGNLAGALSTTRRGGTDAFLDREHRERFFRDKSALPAGSSRS
jgi:sugar/nucleoside kinase (ribokinase family)